MKKSKYTEEQIIGAIKQHEAGTKTQKAFVESFNFKFRDSVVVNKIRTVI
jgi:hypothetical protein